MTGKHRLRPHVRRTSAWLGLAAAGLTAVALVAPSPAAGTAADDTWQGSADTPGAWSVGANWVGGVAPPSDAGELTFPSLVTITCNAEDCLKAVNDMVGNSAEGLSIDDQYQLTGNALRLGAGGITSSATEDMHITMPLVLTAPQTWTLGSDGSGSLFVKRVSGASSLSEPPTLNVDMAKTRQVVFNGDVEVGPLTLSGGRAVLVAFPGVKVAVNVGDGAPLRLTDGSLLWTGKVGHTGPRTGALRAVDGRVFVGNSTLHTASVSLLSASSLRLNIHGRKGVPGASFGQLKAVSRNGRHSNIRLRGATLYLTGHGPHNVCTTMRAGETYPLLTATGSITGRFHGVPNGAVIPATCAGRPGKALTARIKYHRHSVTATAVTSGSHHDHG
jgi:hypothetical protein